MNKLIKPITESKNKARDLGSIPSIDMVLHADGHPRGFESLALHFIIAPSSNGRIADFESVGGGSIPPGASNARVGQLVESGVSNTSCWGFEYCSA